MDCSILCLLFIVGITKKKPTYPNLRTKHQRIVYFYLYHFCLNFFNFCNNIYFSFIEIRKPKNSKYQATKKTSTTLDIWEYTTPIQILTVLSLILGDLYIILDPKKGKKLLQFLLRKFQNKIFCLLVCC